MDVFCIQRKNKYFPVPDSHLLKKYAFRRFSGKCSVVKRVTTMFDEGEEPIPSASPGTSGSSRRKAVKPETASSPRQDEEPGGGGEER